MRRFTADYLERTRAGLWTDREALSDLRLADCDSVLDVGCGSGELTRVLREEVGADARVAGVDRDSNLLVRLPDDAMAVRGDALSLPFAADSFDCVVCQALLVNLPEPERAVQEFARVARKRVAAIEPDNSAVQVESTVEAEAPLARRARDLYVAGVDTDVALGAARALFAGVGLGNVTVRRRDHEQVVEAPYSGAELAAVGRKASGAALRDRRRAMSAVADEETLDELRRAWRAMGREAVAQARDEDYRRREVVPFYVTCGEV